MKLGAELLNLNPVSFGSFPMRRRVFSPLKFQPLLPPPPPTFTKLPPLPILKLGLPSFPRNPWIVAFSASHEDSKHPEFETEKEKELGATEAEEAWKQTLESFKEQALKMESISREAYEVYSQKARVILKETSEQLKIHAEKARSDLTILAKELSQEGKEYLSVAAENSPEPVKEIVEEYSSSTDDVNDISKLHDFHVGIPYGFLLSIGGFLSFMLTGSIPAIRFGIILGGALLGLSIWSLKSFNKGESSVLASKGQAGIAAIIFLREVQMLARGASFFTFLTTIISGATAAFFFYRINLDSRQSGNPDVGYGAEN